MPKNGVSIGGKAVWAARMLARQTGAGMGADATVRGVPRLRRLPECQMGKTGNRAPSSRGMAYEADAGSLRKPWRDDRRRRRISRQAAGAHRVSRRQADEGRCLASGNRAQYAVAAIWMHGRAKGTLRNAQIRDRRGRRRRTVRNREKGSRGSGPAAGEQDRGACR